MKKTYVTPKAEKVVFDYTESVIACWSDWLRYLNQNSSCQVPKTETTQTPTVEVRSKQDTVSNNYWKKISTDYWGC